MKKALIVGTILFTAALLIGGVYYPDYPLMWLAGTSTGYAVVRAALIVILGVLLFSNPPRALYLRYGIGAVAIALGITTAVFLLTNRIGLIDASVFVEIAVIFGLEALETSDNEPVVARSKRTTALAR